MRGSMGIVRVLKGVLDCIHQGRRAVMAVHMRRRERKSRADALKTVPQCVFVQLPRFGRIVALAERRYRAAVSAGTLG